MEPLVELMEESDAVFHLAGESIGAGRWTAGSEAADSRQQGGFDGRR